MRRGGLAGTDFSEVTHRVRSCADSACSASSKGVSGHAAIGCAAEGGTEERAGVEGRGGRVGVFVNDRLFRCQKSLMEGHRSHLPRT